MVGKNLADPSVHESVQKSIFAQVHSPICVFLSYVSEDRDEVKKIGDYIRSAGFNIYMDIFDNKLQQAVKSGDPAAITVSIEKGLSVSTHVMCIVSEDTVQSWWVPYEIGYGKNASKKLSTLTLKNTVTIPAYLEITRLIRGTRSLNDYLKEISCTHHILLESTNSFINQNQYSKVYHPLDSVLNWKE